MISESAMPVNSVMPEANAGHIETTQLSDSTPQEQPTQLTAEQNQQRLQKIEVLIQTGDNTTAKSQSDTINPLNLTAEQQNQFNLLNAQIFLGLGDPEMAIKSLAAISADQLDNSNKIEYLQSQAFAASLTGNALDSAKFRIELNELLTAPELRESNQGAILESLTLLPDEELKSAQSSASDSLAGWLSLAEAFKLKGQPTFNDNIQLWRERFPGHPGNAIVLENPSVATTQETLGKPTVVALLLPESGSLAQAGKAIHAGFMAAYNSPDNPGYKPSIQVYDTEQATALFLYNQAITDGAQLVIGPLQKDALQSLSDSVTFYQPVLALNHIPGLEKDNLYQFGLSPIDDVEAITRKATQDGHQKAVLLSPENTQGQRIASYFSNSWQEVGGTILEIQTYNPRETDFSEPIKKLLNLDESDYRFQQIQQLIPEAKFTPRRRQDADVLFLNANSTEARSINPQLHYYQTNPLPIYATSNIYSGQPNASLDADLDNIIFCDTPWLLDKAYSSSLNRNALKEAWQSLPDAYLRLFAMGIDTFQLITRLKILETEPFEGATGKLSLVADNRIKRDPTCTQFIDGKPELADAITSTKPIAENIAAPETIRDAQPMPEQPQNNHVVQ